MDQRVTVVSEAKPPLDEKIFKPDQLDYAPLLSPSTQSHTFRVVNRTRNERRDFTDEYEYYRYVEEHDGDTLVISIESSNPQPVVRLDAITCA